MSGSAKKRKANTATEGACLISHSIAVSYKIPLCGEAEWSPLFFCGEICYNVFS